MAGRHGSPRPEPGLSKQPIGYSPVLTFSHSEDSYVSIPKRGHGIAGSKASGSL
jgi:hypothetical protein